MKSPKELAQEVLEQDETHRFNLARMGLPANGGSDKVILARAVLKLEEENERLRMLNQAFVDGQDAEVERLEEEKATLIHAINCVTRSCLMEHNAHYYLKKAISKVTVEMDGV